MSRISDRITQPPLLVGLLLITAMSAMPAGAQDCERPRSARSARCRAVPQRGASR